MKILFAAPFSGIRTSIFISNYYDSLARAATRLGHQIEMFDTREIIASSNIQPWMRKLYRPLSGVIEGLRLMAFFETALRRNLLETVEIHQPDVIFLYVINAQSFSSVVHEIRRRGIIVVMWIGLNPKYLSPGVQRILPELDCVFCYDPAYLPYYKNMRCPRVEIVPLGIDIEKFDSVKLNQENLSDAPSVSFVGMIDDIRRRILGSLQGKDLGIWSWNMGAEDTVLEPFFKGEAAGEECIRVLKASPISINIHRSFEFSGGNYRLFEIPACGAMQLVDSKPGIREYFEPDNEIVLFENEEDLREKVDYFLEHEEQRQTIARKARARLERDHGIEDRFKRIEQILIKL